MLNETLSDTDEPSVESRVADNLKAVCFSIDLIHLPQPY